VATNKRIHEQPDRDGLGSAFEHARCVGLAERLLDMACRDRVWKARIEKELVRPGPFKKILRGGSKPSDVWRNGLARRNMVDALKTSALVFGVFASLNPSVPSDQKGARRVQRKAIRAMDPYTAVLAAFYCYPEDDTLQAELVERACSVLEAEIEDAASTAPAETPTPSVAIPTRERKSAKNASLAAADGERQIRLLRKELAAAKGVAQRTEQKRHALAARVKLLEGHAADQEVALKGLRDERDELGRQLNRVVAELQSLKTGKRTIEERRADEGARNQQTIADLQDRVRASADYATAKEREAAANAAELQEEKARREDVEQVLAAFGVNDVESSLSTLQSALQGLDGLRAGIEAYATRERERAAEHARLRDAADLERAAAEAARRARLEQEVAWSAREYERLEAMESELFPGGEVDHILVDGHNLVHRVFRPEDEARTRPWLERMVETMAARLESRDWKPSIHLVFDTTSESNSRPGAHGVRVYFENNVTGGGADAAIARLLREGDPRASYMVVSTDRQHVWADAAEFAASEGAVVDVVQVEMLARFLQALDAVSE
jgi:hypothetical protein